MLVAIIILFVIGLMIAMFVQFGIAVFKDPVGSIKMFAIGFGVGAIVFSTLLFKI